ncbi:MAG: acetolactate decarboxylase [Clostridia bacterium]|jgi:acetolactate decarboxylase|nr:acetolactate decarboxylase [Clostridia bacterium]MBT7123405.1 acetolactate decarboxylase [Clostridia bacterium]
MRRKIIMWAVIFVFSISLLSGCDAQKAKEDSALYQISTLQALMVGAYDGEVTSGHMKHYGDTGLGTFDDLDGEMIVIDGKVYRASVDGSVVEVEDSETIPFANVAFLTTQEPIALSFDGGYDGLKAALDEMFPHQNVPEMFSISGTFTNIEYRSVPEQHEPFPALTEVVKHQAIFKKETISGTIIGFRFPAFFDEMNVTGYHLHFISDDRQNGGHLLDVASGQTWVLAQSLDELSLVFPDNLRDIDMSGTSDSDVKAVESK